MTTALAVNIVKSLVEYFSFYLYFSHVQLLLSLCIAPRAAWRNRKASLQFDSPFKPGDSDLPLLFTYTDEKSLCNRLYHIQ